MGILAWIVMMILNAILWAGILGAAMIVIGAALYFRIADKAANRRILEYVLWFEFIAFIALLTMSADGAFRLIPLLW